MKLLYLFLIPAIFCCENLVAQTLPQAYHVTGRCYDSSAGYGIPFAVPATVYMLDNGNRIKLTQCNKDGDFDALVPTTATHLLLEIVGYRTNTIPIHFTPNIPPNARFSIGGDYAMMTRLDSAAVPIPSDRVNFISLFFDMADSIDFKYVNYQLTSLSTQKSKSLYLPTKRLKEVLLPLLGIMPDNYIDTLFTEAGQFLSSEKITIKPGITFKALRVTNPTAASLTSPETKPIATAPSSTEAVVYFDQSSYELRSQTKNSLDSIAKLLAHDLKLTATVTGYTDNVGQRALNITLSEYRARVVENYLKNRGVFTNQIKTTWKGPDSLASATDTETVKAKSRRVTIKLAPDSSRK